MKTPESKNYECHVTLTPPAPGMRRTVEEIASLHRFKTSVLVGDEAMGDDRLLYLTTHDASFAAIYDRMERVIGDLPKPVEVLRRKIEHIVLDERKKR